MTWSDRDFMSIDSVSQYTMTCTLVTIRDMKILASTERLIIPTPTNGTQSINRSDSPKASTAPLFSNIRSLKETLAASAQEPLVWNPLPTQHLAPARRLHESCNKTTCAYEQGRNTSGVLAT